MLSGKLGGMLEPSAKERRLLELVSCRGLSAAVLSVVVYDELLAAGAPITLDLPLLALFVIFFTNLISAALLLKKGRLKKPDPSPSLGALARGGLDSL
jgi:hypothetical protein